MALVEFKNVEKYYGDYHALRDINLRFEKGQVVVLLGPSGSGKSTLIRTINGLEAVDKGSLLVNGHQVAGASQKDLVPLRKEVGMVFQHFNLYPHKTVLENVTLAPIKVLGIDKKKLKNSPKISGICKHVGQERFLSSYAIWWAKTTDCHCTRTRYASGTPPL